jgi:hypothetical protein
MLKLGENEPDIGLCHDGRLDPVYFRYAGLRACLERLERISTFEQVIRLEVPLRVPLRMRSGSH